MEALIPMLRLAANSPLFLSFFIPETRKVSLEEIDVLFGGANHVEKGANLVGAEDPHHANISHGGDKGGIEQIAEVRKV